MHAKPNGRDLEISQPSSARPGAVSSLDGHNDNAITDALPQRAFEPSDEARPSVSNTGTHPQRAASRHERTSSRIPGV